MISSALVFLNFHPCSAERMGQFLETADSFLGKEGVESMATDETKKK